MDSQPQNASSVKARLRWLYIPPVATILLAVVLRRIFDLEYRTLALQWQSFVDILVALSPLPGIFIVWFIIERRRKRDSRTPQ